MAPGRSGSQVKLQRKKSSFWEQTMLPKTAIELSHEERELLNEAFERAVGTKAGINDREVLRHLLEDVHQPCESDVELDSIFASMDSDGDGMINLDEFIKFLERKKLHQQAEGSEVMNMFVAFGGNNDGTGTVAMDVITGILNDFELDFDIVALVEAERTREEIAISPSFEGIGDPAPKSPPPDPTAGEPNEIGYRVFAKVFENLLTHRHFRAPSFNEVN